jgi:hypothetical protein
MLHTTLYITSFHFRVKSSSEKTGWNKTTLHGVWWRFSSADLSISHSNSYMGSYQVISVEKHWGNPNTLPPISRRTVSAWKTTLSRRLTAKMATDVKHWPPIE